jgi:hypothetical protein
MSAMKRRKFITLLGGSSGGVVVCRACAPADARDRVSRRQIVHVASPDH